MIRTRRFWIFRMLPLVGVGVIALLVIPADLSAGRKFINAVPAASPTIPFKSVPRVSATAAPSLTTPSVTKVSLLTSGATTSDQVGHPWVDWSSLPLIPVASQPGPAREPPGLTPAHVGYSGVNVRSGPAGSAAKLFVLQPGAAIKTAETVNGWTHTYAGGTDGWVYSTFLVGNSSSAAAARAPREPQNPASLGRIVRIKGPVTLRDAPDGVPVYDLQPGERVQIAETDGKWVRVLTVSGDTGWVLTR